ncbi:MAG: hypothetical protein EOO75_15280 [Myxococcales bacterium]|nr:MAG: hypothetical protein EOO75_15280 [Myxococcales bacterium]
MVGGRELTERVRDTIVKGLGATLSPFNAFLIGRGLHTLALRMAQATATTARLAAALERHPAVGRVHHSSLASHPDHELGRRQMRAPPAVLSFEVRGGSVAARRVLDAVRLVRQAVSLGDARTLLTHPASTTASTMPAGDRARAGIGEGLLRLAVGLEDAVDLEADLTQALAASADAATSEVTA